MNVFLIIILFSVLILGHELGHFLTAKKLGAKVEEFGFGLPPRVFGVWKDKEDGSWHYKWGPDEKEEDEEKEGGEAEDQSPSEAENKQTNEREATIYSVNLLPLGGFVKIFGEEGEHGDDPRSFAAQPIWKRAIMLLGGVTMNIVLAIIFFSIVSGLGAPQAVQGDIPWGGKKVEERVQILKALSDSPAEKVGLGAGDVIKELRGAGFEKEITKVDQVQSLTKKYSGQEITMVIGRGDETLEKKITPRKDPPSGEGALGIGLAKTALVEYPWYLAPVRGFVKTFKMTWMMLVAFGVFFKTLIFQGEMMGEIAGPVGIVNMSSQAAKLGLGYLLNFGAIISINLAIINALPIPALDGGRLLFLGIEKVKGEAVSKEIEQRAHQIGFALLMILILVLTVRDVQGMI